MSEGNWSTAEINVLSGREAIRKRPYFYIGKENVFANIVEGIIGFSKIHPSNIIGLNIDQTNLYVHASFELFKNPVLVKYIAMELKGSLGQNKLFEKTADLIICILTAVSEAAIFNITIGNDNYMFAFKSGDLAFGKKNHATAFELTLNNLEALHELPVKKFWFSCHLDRALVVDR